MPHDPPASRVGFSRGRAGQLRPARNPPRQRFLSNGLSSTDCFALLVGAGIHAAVTVMREAARLSAENAAFV